MHNNTTKEFFDKNSKDWNKHYEAKSNDLISWYFKNRKKIVLSMFDFRNSKVLDVGCGPGVFSKEILKKGNKLWGIDLSSKMIQEVKKRMNGEYPKAIFSTGDICNLNFPNNFFDVVVAIGVLEYIKDDKKAFSELGRVVKKGGILIVTVINKHNPNYWLRKFFNFFLKHLKFNNLIFQDICTKAYSRSELNRILYYNNFEIVDYANCNYRFFPLHRLIPWLFIYLSKRILPKSQLGFLHTEKILKIRKVK